MTEIEGTVQLKKPVRLDIMPGGGCAINGVVYPPSDAVAMIVRTAFGPYLAEYARQNGIPIADPKHTWTFTGFNAETGMVTLEGREE